MNSANDDGFLLVHQHGLDNPSTFPFSQVKSWNWVNETSVLLIRMAGGRVEIPRESISRLEVSYNTHTDEYMKIVDFANGGHDGQVHPAGD